MTQNGICTQLTSQAGWAEHYEITVYQMGWRLGGKGASSRNPDMFQRIEEHGLHIWIGFYENAFQIIRRCYAELARVEGSPLATWDQAFKPHSFVVLEEHIDDTWIHWPSTFPTNDLVPGDGNDFPSLSDYAKMATQWLADAFDQEPALHALGSDVFRFAEAPLAVQTALATSELVAPHPGAALLDAATSIVASLPDDPDQHGAAEHHAVHWSLGEFIRIMRARVESEIAHDRRLRRAWIPIELVACTVRGLFADGAVLHGLDTLDDYDIREWLRKHGASEISLDSAWLRGAYDLAFSFIDGDASRPNCAAGSAVRAMLRMVFAYKGAILWKMQAGMGETVFTPLYEVLRRRGVQFQFFARVKELSLNADKDTIESILIARQATVKVEPYEPLINVGDLGCWRHRPDYEQLVEGDALREGAVDLESFWTPWIDPRETRLEVGRDFDIVVLGIPVAALRSICEPLVEVSSRWREMVDGVKTIQTQGFQVWLRRDLQSCGWRYPSPILGGYVEPLDTWADMSHLLESEGWPTADRPTQLAYFVGVMPDARNIPPSTDHDFPAREKMRVKEAAIAFLEQEMVYMWPAAADPAAPTRLDWSVLHAPDDVAGVARFDAHAYSGHREHPDRRIVNTLVRGRSRSGATCSSGLWISV